MKNTYEVIDTTVNITVLNKKGKELVAKIDKEDLEKVSMKNEWFAEWNKDYNNYVVQSISTTKVNGHPKSIKESLGSVILDTHFKAPIKHINGDTLDNRKDNLKILERNRKNDIEEIEENTIAIVLKDKLDKVEGKALISKEDKNLVINDTYSWVYYKNHGNPAVVANTPNGRIFLESLLLTVEEGQYIYHINKNPLDCRRENLEVKERE